MNPNRWQQIEELYHAALERKAEARTAFLQKACAGDEGLRREVESLLAHGEQAGSLIERPALEVAAQALAEDQGDSGDMVQLGNPTQSGDLSDTLVGRQLGRHRIVSLIGRGGMGEVYQATDTKLKREVAIKVLPQAFARDPERLARFEREARMLAQLDHPNIAAIHDFEECGGVHYLVMELVGGQTLAEMLCAGGGTREAVGSRPEAGGRNIGTASVSERRGSVGLPIDEVLIICRQVAEGLEAAHDREIYHRDIKPANIKVTPEGKVKILDFGLAKAFDRDRLGVDLSQLPTASGVGTEDGRILGTPAYMSPEQVRGKKVDKRAQNQTGQGQRHRPPPERDGVDSLGPRQRSLHGSAQSLLNLNPRIADVPKTPIGVLLQTASQ